VQWVGLTAKSPKSLKMVKKSPKSPKKIKVQQVQQKSKKSKKKSLNKVQIFFFLNQQKIKFFFKNLKTNLKIQKNLKKII
jgi:hypothetical protein